MKTPAEIAAAAQKVVHERLRYGVSIAYVDGVLAADPAWDGAPMEDLERVRALVHTTFTAYMNATTRPTPIRRIQ